MRIVSAMVAIACEDGVQAASVSRVSALARVAPATFYRLFADRDDCLLAALEQALALAQARAQAAHDAHEGWADSVRAALFALLCLFDEDPRVARLCVLHAHAAGPAALARRGEVLEQLARVLARGSLPRAAPAITAQALVGGALAIVHARLLRADPRPLAELLGPLMSMLVLPYLGGAAARRELDRPAPRPQAHRERARWRDPSHDPLAELGLSDLRLTYRTLRVLSAIGAQPGLSNAAVGARAGIADPGQISRLLSRLSRLALLENTGPGKAIGAANAWHLTPAGSKLEHSFRP
jgi:AcrR family transcriptional regulator